MQSYVDKGVRYSNLALNIVDTGLHWQLEGPVEIRVHQIQKLTTHAVD